MIRTMNSRGQFESMGLALIVVLVSLGMLLLLIFSFDTDSDPAGQYEREQLAQNVVNAITSTDVANCPVDVTDLIEDIVLVHKNPCGEDSKTVLTSVIDPILKETIEEQKLNYRFEIREAPLASGTVIYERGNCDLATSEQDKPGQQPLILYPSNRQVLVTLWICT